MGNAWWRRIWQKRITVESPATSAPFLAREHGLDRRLKARVRLPAHNADYLPIFKNSSRELTVVDLSVGGVCLLDFQDFLLNHLSQTVPLTLQWPDREEWIMARVAGVSRHTHRHLQFLELSEQSQKQIKVLVQMGSYGQKITQVRDLKQSPAQLLVTELWTGLQGDGLVFYDSADTLAELTMGLITVRFHHSIAPQVVLDPDRNKTRPALNKEISDALICLANIPEPSGRLKDLLLRLSTPTQPWLTTGSGV
ncbi:MAG: hypothetical protein AB7N80_12500 [Bdellovibrionales bacterium]